MIVYEPSKILSAPKTSGVVINNFIGTEIFVPHSIKFSDSVTDIALAAANDLSSTFAAMINDHDDGER